MPQRPSETETIRRTCTFSAGAPGAKKQISRFAQACGVLQRERHPGLRTNCRPCPPAVLAGGYHCWKAPLRKEDPQGGNSKGETYFREPALFARARADCVNQDLGQHTPSMSCCDQMDPAADQRCFLVYWLRMPSSCCVRTDCIGRFASTRSSPMPPSPSPCPVGDIFWHRLVDTADPTTYRGHLKCEALILRAVLEGTGTNAMSKCCRTKGMRSNCASAKSISAATV